MYINDIPYIVNFPYDSRGENKDNNNIGSDFKIDIKRMFHLY